MQLTDPPREGEPEHIATMVNVVQPDVELNWNHHAATRMDWGNVSHILETVARNGGEKELYAVLAARPGRDKGRLKALENAAAMIYGRAENVRDDLKGDNW